MIMGSGRANMWGIIPTACVHIRHFHGPYHLRAEASIACGAADGRTGLACHIARMALCLFRVPLDLGEPIGGLIHQAVQRILRAAYLLHELLAAVLAGGGCEHQAKDAADGDGYERYCEGAFG